MTDTTERKDWPWWWSTDEERFRGPCNSRADAILEAWAEHCDDGAAVAFVCQATQDQALNTRIFEGHRLAEMFDDANEEAQDPDGDGIAGGAKPEEWDKLAERLNAMVKVFARDHGLTSWSFSGQTKLEVISLKLNPERAGRMESALIAARAQFLNYMAHHQGKDPPDNDKAKVNAEFADMIAEALEGAQL